MYHSSSAKEKGQFHSTPAVFECHSVEPVPFAAAPVSVLAKCQHNNNRTRYASRAK